MMSFCRFWRKRRNARERRGNLTLRRKRRRRLSLSARKELEGRGAGSFFWDKDQLNLKKYLNDLSVIT